MQTSTADERVWPAATPEPEPEPYTIYYANHKPPRRDWIIQGTDGKLYLVPGEAGG